MINLQDKHGYIVAEIERQGHSILKINNEWVCSDEAAVQNIIDNYNPLDKARESALERINKQTQAYIDSQMESYPFFEQQTWELQRQEAAAYLLDNTADTPTIDTIANHRGLSRLILIERINTKTESWRDLSAKVAGIRQGLLDQVWTETDYTQIEQINFEI